jgi:cell division protein FtsQ
MTLSPPDLRSNSDAEETVLLDWRRHRNRRRLVLGISIPLLVLVLIAGGIYVVGFSSVLAVKSVRITGTKDLTNDAVAQIAAVPYGAPMARTDIAAIQHRVAAIRQVETATVHRDWPNTIQIHITERTAVYAVDQGGSSYLLVDRFGVGFRTAGTSSQLPQATVSPANPRLLTAVGTVASALPPSLRHRLDRIDAGTQDSITLRLKDGDIVFWGSSDQSALKARVIVGLLRQNGSRYDVSAPGNPAVR